MRRANKLGADPKLVGWYQDRRGKYSGTRDLSLEGWGHVLTYRQHVATSIKRDASDEQSKMHFRAISDDPLARRVVQIPLLRPAVHELSPVEITEVASIYAKPPWDKIIAEWKQEQPPGGVGNAVLAQIFQGAPRHQDIPTLHALSLDPELNTAPDRWQSEHQHFAQMGINLAVADDVLVDAFKTWLAEQRKAMKAIGVKWGRSPPRGNKDGIAFSSTVLKRWCRKQVLDYIDLGIAADFMQVKPLTHQQASELLFPRRKVAASYVSSQVAPLAKWLLEPETLAAIGSKWLTDHLATQA